MHTHITTTLDLSWLLNDRDDLYTLAGVPDAETFWEGELHIEARVGWEVADRWSPGGVTDVELLAVELDGCPLDLHWIDVLGIEAAIADAIVGG